MSIFDIPLRSAGNPFLTSKEVNALLLHLRGIKDSRRIISGTTGTSIRDVVGGDTTINAYFNQDIPAYSIFTIDDISAEATPYNPARAFVEGEDILDMQLAGDNWPYFQNSLPYRYAYPMGNGNPPTERTLYITNGKQPVNVGTAMDCDIVGTDTARQIRYSGPTAPNIGSRMEYVGGTTIPFNFDRYTVTVSNQGPFIAVSNPDTSQKLVWIVGFLPENVDTAWVRTTVDQRAGLEIELQTYPSDPANKFVVERGILTFTRIPGNETPVFVPYSPRQLYVALSPCGYLQQGTICRMTYDRGYHYLLNECPFGYSSSSLSSSSLSSSSSSSPSSSSSVPSSSSSVPSSSSSIPSSSSSIPSSSSSVPSSSSSVPSSSSSVPSSSSISSSSSSMSIDDCCYATWEDQEFPFEGQWQITTKCGEPECAQGGTCVFDPPLPFPGDFDGQRINGLCIT